MLFINTIICLSIVFFLVIIGFFIRFVVTEIRDWKFIKEYRRTNEWNEKASEKLKMMVIPNEEYEG